MDLFICGCCQKPTPTINRNTHHKTPRHLGGKDIQSNLIELCPSCHDGLHAISHRMLSRQASNNQILDAIALMYPDNIKARAICLELALQVRNATITSKEKGFDKDRLLAIGTTIRMYYKPLIMDRIRELNISQESYLRGLVLTDIAKRFNLNISLSEEKQILDNIKKQKTIIASP